MVYAAVIFFGSLIGIAILFAIKYWEMRRGMVMAPGVRTRADEYALELKALLVRGRAQLATVPPTLVYLSRALLHEGALGFARLARAAEQQAHKLADLVSHKHRFEKREPRSEYLRRMNGHKNGDGELGESENI